MSLRIFMAGAMLATLGACGEDDGNAQAANDRGPTTTASVVASGSGPADCSKLPAFVPLYDDARVETCVTGAGEPGRESGTVIYTTGAAPAAIIAWYRDKAKSDAMAEALSTPTLLSVRDASGSSLMALVETVKGTTKVTLNWGRNT